MNQQDKYELIKHLQDAAHGLVTFSRCLTAIDFREAGHQFIKGNRPYAGTKQLPYTCQTIHVNNLVMQYPQKLFLSKHYFNN